MNTQCKQFREKFEDYLLGLLSPLEKKNLEAHLASCGDCQQEFEKEKKLLGLFQSMERKPAPEVLRQRVLDFAQKQKEKGDWKGRLSAILTWPRLRMLTGAAALALLAFWCVQIVRAPRPLEKPPVKVSQDTRSMALRMEAPKEKSAELKSKASYLEIMDKNEDISQESPVLSSPAPEISKKAVFKEEMAEGFIPAPSRSPISLRGGKLVGEGRLDDKTDRDMDETALNFKRRTGVAGYLDITERLKAFGASQISHLEKLDSEPNRYAFAISYGEFERFKKEIENTNIRIVNVKPFVVAGSVLEAKRGETLLLRQTQQVDSFYSQQPQPQFASRAAQPAAESIAPKSASQRPVMKGNKEMETEFRYIPKDAPTLPSVTASPSPSGSIVTNGIQAQAPQKQQESLSSLTQIQPSEYNELIKKDIGQRKSGDTAWHTDSVFRDKGQIMDVSSSPTIIQTQDGTLRNRLTNEESLVYVEIEVEPDK